MLIFIQHGPRSVLLGLSLYLLLPLVSLKATELRQAQEETRVALDLVGRSVMYQHIKPNQSGRPDRI